MTSEKKPAHERRRFHRILFDAPTTLHSGDSSYDITLIDISLKGALIVQPPEWSPTGGDQVTLVIQLDDGTSQIRMAAIVAHTEDGRVGLQCEDIDLDSISHLRRLAELNLGDASLVERELSALG